MVYVATTRDKGGAQRGASRGLSQETGILKDASDLAARYEVDITTTLRVNRAPEAAILREIDATDIDLVVMGVDRIQADHLSFGGVADAVIRQSKALGAADLQRRAAAAGAGGLAGVLVRRHCEEQSDEAIQNVSVERSWIAARCASQ